MFDVEHVWQELRLFKEYPKINFTKNQGLNQLVIDSGIGNFLFLGNLFFFIKLSPTYLTAYQSNNTPPSLYNTTNKGVLRNFTKFTGKHLRQSLFFNKVAGLKLISKNTFFTEHLWTTASNDGTFCDNCQRLFAKNCIIDF